jgi:hypothetical protein
VIKDDKLYDVMSAAYLIAMRALSICGSGKRYDEVAVDILFAASSETNVEIGCLVSLLLTTLHRKGKLTHLATERGPAQQGDI